MKFCCLVKSSTPKCLPAGLTLIFFPGTMHKVRGSFHQSATVFHPPCAGGHRLTMQHTLGVLSTCLFQSRKYARGPQQPLPISHGNPVCP